MYITNNNINEINFQKITTCKKAINVVKEHPKYSNISRQYDYTKNTVYRAGLGKSELLDIMIMYNKSKGFFIQAIPKNGQLKKNAKKYYYKIINIKEEIEKLQEWFHKNESSIILN